MASTTAAKSIALSRHAVNTAISSTKTGHMIADWYHLGEVRRRGVRPVGLHQEWRTNAG
jgi:hypothetical protein